MCPKFTHPLLKQMADELIGLPFDQLTKWERGMLAILCDAGLLELDEQHNVTHHQHQEEEPSGEDVLACWREEV